MNLRIFSLVAVASFACSSTLLSADPKPANAKATATIKAAPAQAKETKTAAPASTPEKPSPAAKASGEKAPAAKPAPAKPAPNKNADPFDGKTLLGWTTQDGKPVEQGWEVVDGVIHLKKDGKRAGNIVTAREFGDFDLSFEWKIAPRGNSGIKYRVRSYNGKVLGCEYQIFDDVGTKTSTKSKNSSGSLYDLYEPNDDKQLKPVGEYNTGRIVVKGQQIEHWLNGKKIVSATAGDAVWKKNVAASKFNDVRNFSLHPGGKLMLTDHGSEVWYRNVTFVASPAPPPPPEPMVVKHTYAYKKVGDLEIMADVEYEAMPDEVAKGEAATTPRPVVVWIHGGALINGHRESVPSWLRDAFLPRGFAVVSIDYRLAPETKLPEIVADVEAAVQWVRTSGPKSFGADPKRIAIVGGSAGGYLTLTAGSRLDTQPQALVSLWGYGDLGAPWTFEKSKHARHAAAKFAPEDASKIATGDAVSDSRKRKTDAGAYYQFSRRTGGWAEAVSGWSPQRDAKKFEPYMPERNVTAKFPPTLLIHGDADTDVPFASSVQMAAQLKKQKVEHRLLRFDDAEHGLTGADPKKVAEAYKTAVDFIVKQLAD